MKARMNIFTLSYLCCFTINSLFAQYTGGSSDGSDLLTSIEVSYLDGRIPFAFSKFYGGSYDGYVTTAAAEGQDISLPVTLTLFTLSEISLETAVRITWQTESEIENAYWLLLRKNEYDSTFVIVEKVDGQGNCTIFTEYSYIDREVDAGTEYTYQLVDVSLIGEKTYHKEKSITVSVPGSFELFQNYPNPFNPYTHIKYAIPVPARVQLKIYNILGQKIVDLLDQYIKAGYHTIQWNGSNSMGCQVASGMYIYLMMAEGSSKNGNQQFHEIRRMILVK